MRTQSNWRENPGEGEVAGGDSDGAGLLERVREHERWAMQRNTPPSVTADAAVGTKTAAASAPAEGQAMTVSSTPEVDPKTLMAVDGPVHEVDCAHKPAVTLSMIVGEAP